MLTKISDGFYVDLDDVQYIETDSCGDTRVYFKDRGSFFEITDDKDKELFLAALDKYIRENLKKTLTQLLD